MIMMTPDDTDDSPVHLEEGSVQRANTFPKLKDNVKDTTSKLATRVSRAASDAISADVPRGAWAAASRTSAKAPTLKEIRTGAFPEPGLYSRAELRETRGGGARLSVIGDLEEKASRAVYGVSNVCDPEHGMHTVPSQDPSISTREKTRPSTVPIPQAKIPWTRSIIISLEAFWKWFLTPFGFLLTIYALNVVAWGGMLFLLLCNAVPAMCWVRDAQNGWKRDCNDLYSPRRIWIEIDSQILNALFCVTGFGLIPWRFRDLYYLLQWRALPANQYGRRKLDGLRILAGIYAGWVRLPGSDTLEDLSLEEYHALAVLRRPNLQLAAHEALRPSLAPGARDPRMPLPLHKTAPPPMTGKRAPPTRLWKIDFFVWSNGLNTVFQACLCGFMWGYNRFDRPPWSTGLFVALACGVAGAAGVMSYVEGRRIRRVEGGK